MNIVTRRIMVRRLLFFSLSLLDIEIGSCCIEANQKSSDTQKEQRKGDKPSQGRSTVAGFVEPDSPQVPQAVAEARENQKNLQPGNQPGHHLDPGNAGEAKEVPTPAEGVV